MDIGVKATLKQLNLGFKDLERIASVAPDDGNVMYAVGRTKAQAKEALDDLAAAGEKLFDRFKVPKRDEKTGKIVDYYIPVTKQREHDRILKQMLEVEVELYGYTFTVAEAKEHFKPTGNEYATLLGWLIKPDKPAEKEKGYTRPNLEALIDAATADLEQKDESSKVLSLVNGSADPVEHQVD
jgi:hypothetical protein